MRRTSRTVIAACWLALVLPAFAVCQTSQRWPPAKETFFEWTVTDMPTVVERYAPLVARVTVKNRLVDDRGIDPEIRHSVERWDGAKWSREFDWGNGELWSGNVGGCVGPAWFELEHGASLTSLQEVPHLGVIGRAGRYRVRWSSEVVSYMSERGAFERGGPFRRMPDDFLGRSFSAWHEFVVTEGGAAAAVIDDYRARRTPEWELLVQAYRAWAAPESICRGVTMSIRPRPPEVVASHADASVRTLSAFRLLSEPMGFPRLLKVPELPDGLVAKLRILIAQERMQLALGYADARRPLAAKHAANQALQWLSTGMTDEWQAVADVFRYLRAELIDDEERATRILARVQRGPLQQERPGGALGFLKHCVHDINRRRERFRRAR